MIYSYVKATVVAGDRNYEGMKWRNELFLAIVDWF